MRYFKIFNELDNHNNFQFKDGSNTDSQKFNSNPNQKCGSGGLYFSNKNNILEFLHYGPFIREVEIPKYEKNIVHFKDKSRAKSLFLHPKKDLRKLETWHWLKEKKVNLRVDYENALRWAAYNGNLEIVKFLVQNGANVNAEDDSALLFAAENGHLEVVEFLLENGADVNAMEDQALRWAAYNGNLEVCQFLVKSGANVHALEVQALCCAAENGHLEVVKFLVKNGPNVDAWKKYALSWAAENNHLEVVEYLETVD
jgi:ankyrin repeat protein